MKYKPYFWVLFAASAVLFFAPIRVEEHTGLGLDKLFHLVLFIALYILAAKSYPGRSWRVAVWLVFYAVAVEFIQGEYLPLRSFDVWDMVAGWAGILVAVIYRSSFITEHSEQ